MAIEAVEDVMADVQEYASAWSLVGSRFDDGSLIGAANDLKVKLRAKLARLLREPNPEVPTHGT